MDEDEQTVVVVEWQGKAIGSIEKVAADAALRALHTFPVKRRLDPAEFMTLQTEGSLDIGRDSFETDEEWRAFTRLLGLGNVPADFRVSLSPEGDQRLTDHDVEAVEVSGYITFLG
ncbi:hypothetical protein C0214_10850 [Methylobacterium sp. DM1]|nr:hypothetical protein C0214_10850 [Methylobacterium sp. DM1]